MLVPPDQPVQMIDVRDLAAWTIRLLEDERSGPFNATSPPHAISFDSMLEACGASDVVRVTERFLADQGVKGWSDLPCWIPPPRPTSPASSSFRSTARWKPGSPSGRSPRPPAMSRSGRARRV